MRIRGNLGLAIASLLLSGSVLAGGPGSRYLQMTSDRYVPPGTAELLTTSIQLPVGGWVYVQSDGRFNPWGAALASTYITIDGVKATNDSVIDWRQSTSGQQHSFNVIGAKYLAAGSHTVSLYGVSTGAPTYFGSGSNLSVLVTGATAVTSNRTGADSAPLNFNTVGTPEGGALQGDDWAPMVSVYAGNSDGPIVAMASGRSYKYAADGDAMLGIFLNAQEPGIDSMTWSINDIWNGAETQAPMFSQALFSAPPSNSIVTYAASESPYWQPQDLNTNNVSYKVGSGSALVTLANGFQVVGRGLNPQFDYGTAGPYKRYAYVCVGSSQGWPGCTPTGTEAVIGRGQFCIPAGHNGTVLFSTKTRIQGASEDPGGTVRLYLKLNGVPVGSTGVQQLGPPPRAISTRTISASYLSAEGGALAPGCHTVEAVALVEGTFKHLSMNADMPIVWFD